MTGNTQKWASLAGVLGIITSQFLVTSGVWATNIDVINEGKKLTFDRKKGNCLACHNIIGAPSPGNIAPALIAMQSRYPTKEALYQQVWDPTIKNPESTMPPFGKHGILSKSELNQVIEYLWTL
jgi:sulfur-oxidizing protein SoxX